MINMERGLSESKVVEINEIFLVTAALIFLTMKKQVQLLVDICLVSCAIFHFAILHFVEEACDFSVRNDFCWPSYPILVTLIYFTL